MDPLNMFDDMLRLSILCLKQLGQVMFEANMFEANLMKKFDNVKTPL